MTRQVAILGVGTMGAGIAQLAVQHGWTVYLIDVDQATVRAAIDGICKRLDRLVEKTRITPDDRKAAAKRLKIATYSDQLDECELFIEAIIEELDIKAKAISPWIGDLRPDCIIATNTSSLSVSRLGKELRSVNKMGVLQSEAHRVVGMHFFNPAPLMKLVEVIAGDNTDPAVVNRVAAIAESWGKVVARAADVPGFIVNHVARPYYLEAFRILEDGLASPDAIDSTMKDLAGFRMGPLELTDLIGQDVNTATTRSVWEQLDRPPLLAPSALQEGLVVKGNLGRKTGRGVYDYSNDPPTVALEIEQRELKIEGEAQATLAAFVAGVTPADRRIPNAEGPSRLILARILCGLIVQAHLAHARGVASRNDIDTALKFGVNYPKGPFEWAEQIGADVLAPTLELLNNLTGSDRFTLQTGAGVSR